MCNLKYTLSFLILVGLIFFTSCNDADVTNSAASKKNDKFLNGPLTSLEGTVWIHHPDTDIESANWFNIQQSPINFSYEEEYNIDRSVPVKLSFTKDRIFDGGKCLFTTQVYSYLYEYPKVLVSQRYQKPGFCECPNPMLFNYTSDCQCMVGIGLRDGFVGYVNETGDTMNLRRHHYNSSYDTLVLHRDVVLIRIK